MVMPAMAQGQAMAAASTTPAVELKVGDMAPDFNLEGTDGKRHKASDYRGKQALVIAWFPKAYTQGCTIECKSLAANGAKIREFDVAYFMASVDPLEDNKGFAAQEKADFPLLSDPTKATATAYGVLGTRGVANRWTFYIGKDGRITAIEKTVRPATSAEDMIAKLAELKVARK
ncbi:MAG: redoxin domain-containing protein [Acidobacteria bacterium]|nr:redoxin domain-containing protein [Acidobacteriota bacterium]